MKLNLIDPFVGGVEGLLASMFDLSCRVTEIAEAAPTYVSGVISLDGDSKGQVAITLAKDVATRLVGRMLELDAVDVDDEILQDGVGELANIVVGDGKAKLDGDDHHVSLSVPSVVTGENHKLRLFRSSDACGRAIHTDVGVFYLWVWFATSDNCCQSLIEK